MLFIIFTLFHLFFWEETRCTRGKSLSICIYKMVTATFIHLIIAEKDNACMRVWYVKLVERWLMFWLVGCYEELVNSLWKHACLARKRWRPTSHSPLHIMIEGPSVSCIITSWFIRIVTESWKDSRLVSSIKSPSGSQIGFWNKYSNFKTGQFKKYFQVHIRNLIKNCLIFPSRWAKFN